MTNGTNGVGREIVRSLERRRAASGRGRARPGEFDDGSLKPPTDAASAHHGPISSPVDCARVMKEVVDQLDHPHRDPPAPDEGVEAAVALGQAVALLADELSVGLAPIVVCEIFAAVDGLRSVGRSLLIV